MMTIGIDPGLTGAIAFVDEFDILEILDLPTVALPGDGLISRRIDGDALYRMVDARVHDNQPMQVFCEAVKTMGGKDNAVQTQGSLMRTLGAIEAVFDVMCCPCQPVEPQAWQKFFGLQGKHAEGRKKGELPAAIRMAKTLFPDCGLRLVGHHNKAEALLIAHFGRRTAA
jgi:hypothetical protein